jgi:hypothetical protein
MKAIKRRQFQMKNITEAQLLLLIRAAKIAQLRKMESPDVSFFEILENAFAENHIRFQKCVSDYQPTGASQQSYLCFGNLNISVVDQTLDNKERIISSATTSEVKEPGRQVTIIYTNQQLIVKTHLNERGNIGTGTNP